MKIKSVDEVYIEKAKLLTEDEVERLMSRTGNKLRRRQDKDKSSILEILAMQLKFEDKQLQEWRKVRAAIKEKEKTK
jgi:hypothetical protein